MILVIKILLSLLLAENNYSSVGISNYLKEELSGYEKIEYTVISPKNIEEINYTIDKTRKFKLTGNYAYLPIVENKNNGSSQNTFITLKLKLYKKVLVANRLLKKRENLNDSDFKIKFKEVSSLRFEPISNIQNITEYRAKYKISENTILQNSMIEKIPDVMIGDRIEALFLNNSISISFNATSRSEGCIGNIIKIKSDDHRIFKAKVLNNSTVKIVE